MGLSSFKAVFFDAGGTLFHPYPSVGEIYAEVAGRYGCQVRPAEVEKNFREIWLAKDAMTSSKTHSNEKIEKEWWSQLVREVFSRLGEIPDFEGFFEELYHVFADPGVWRLYPGTVEVLNRLKEQRCRLGIVSNWDSRLFGLVSGLGLEGYFEFVLASAVFGFSKPHPKIFEEALRRMGVLPQEAVHIGDSLEDDVSGAVGAGLEAIFIDRHDPEGTRHHTIPEKVRIIRHLSELL
jgi:putative hydrolase of the HAD superfamily